MESWESSEYKIQKGQLQIFINIFDHQSMNCICPPFHISRVHVGLSVLSVVCLRFNDMLVCGCACIDSLSRLPKGSRPLRSP